MKTPIEKMEDISEYQKHLRDMMDKKIKYTNHKNLTDYTHFGDEIETNYRPTTWTDRLIIAAALLVLIALPFLIADLIWGAEVVTEWVANLV
jgi:hypothetical protein